MGRYRHFVHPVKGEHIPGRVICIDADVDYAPVADGAVAQRGSLARWASVGWDTDERGNRRDYGRNGTTIADLWKGVSWCLRRRGITLAVSWCASRLWGVAGLWEGIDRGRYTICTGGQSPGAGVRRGGVVRALPQDNARSGGAPSVAAGAGVPGVQSGVGYGRDATPLPAQGRRLGEPLIVIEDPPTIIPIRVRGLPGTLQIVDVRNWGVDQYPGELTVRQRAQWVADFMASMCSILHQNGWGGLRLTGGAQASAIWRHSYLTHPVWVHTHQPTLDLEGGAYYGGRCECHRVGPVAGPVYHLDFRAAYGTVCRDCALPTGLAAPTSSGAVRAAGVRDDPLCHCARVRVRVEEPLYPVRTKDGIVYPVGEFDTMLAGPELRCAVESGHLLVVRSSARYNLATALGGYARAILQAVCGRSAGLQDGVGRWLKHLLVALPGRFGQRDLNWRRVDGLRPPAPWCVWWHPFEGSGWRRVRSLDWQCWVEERGGWAQDASPAIAAWITSYQRIRLLECLRAAGWGEVYYCDTDGMLCSQVGYDRLCAARLVSGGEPGRLRLVGQHATGAVYGIKHYRLDDTTRCSGVPAGRYDPAGDCGTGWVHQWIKRALQDYQRPDVVRVLEGRTRTERYRHRVVMADGSTAPLRIVW